MEEKKFDYSELDKFIQDVEELRKKYPHLYICIWNDQKESKGHVRIEADILYFPEGKKRHHPLEEVKDTIVYYRKQLYNEAKQRNIQAVGKVKMLEIC